MVRYYDILGGERGPPVLRHYQPDSRCIFDRLGFIPKVDLPYSSLDSFLSPIAKSSILRQSLPHWTVDIKKDEIKQNEGSIAPTVVNSPRRAAPTDHSR